MTKSLFITLKQPHCYFLEWAYLHKGIKRCPCLKESGSLLIRWLELAQCEWSGKLNLIQLWTLMWQRMQVETTKQSECWLMSTQKTKKSHRGEGVQWAHTQNWSTGTSILQEAKQCITGWEARGWGVWGCWVIIEMGFTETTHWNLIIFKSPTLKVTCDWGSISFKSRLDSRSLSSRVEGSQPEDFNDLWARLWPNLQPLQSC